MDNPEKLATLGTTQDGDNPEKLATLGTTQDGDKQNKNITQKTKKMSNMDLTKNRRWTQAHAKEKQFLPLIRHPPCYSYS